MKTSRLLSILFLLSLFVFWGCEGDQGPAGPAGPAGQDGVDGDYACLACHNTDVQNAISLQYDRSGHALGENVGYAGGRASCARCHSGGGFVEYAENGFVDGNIAVPVAIDCEHCHSIHTTFEEGDYALRMSGEVAWIFDEGYGDSSVDFGDNSNVCANCHQSRRGEPELTNPGEAEFTITSTHWGPHHGAQANVLAGEGFAEIAGSVDYPTAMPNHVGMGVTCVGCHMAEYTDGEGGHTWHASLDYCTNCHSSATDFDVNGVQTDTQAQLDALRDLLLDQGVIEWVAEDEAYEPIPGTYTQAQAQAFFNWIGLVEDRSNGVHNPAYVNALLTNTIEAITP
jgi:formate-dependent nitrite reductase cytochrome c552 subunit